MAASGRFDEAGFRAEASAWLVFLVCDKPRTQVTNAFGSTLQMFIDRSLAKY